MLTKMLKKCLFQEDLLFNNILLAVQLFFDYVAHLPLKSLIINNYRSHSGALEQWN